MKKKLLFLTLIILSLLAFSTGFIKIDLTASFTFPDLPEKNTKYEYSLINLLRDDQETEAETKAAKKKKKAEAETEPQTEVETEAAKKKKKAEAETEPQTEAETKAAKKKKKAEAETEPQTEAETKAAKKKKKAEVETEPQTEAETKAAKKKKKAEAETEPQTEAETKAAKKKKKAEAETEPQTETEAETKAAKVPRVVPVPEIDKQFLTKNAWSRPGDKVKKVEKIVIHYLGNPGSTAQDNRDYFESLKDLQNAYMSSTFIVGLDGEIIQCVPEKEVAYCTKDTNRTSISIESCHLDSTGKYLANTYISMVKLTAYLSEKYQIGRNGIVRHYDCTGKECPRYFFDHPKAWKRFVNDVMKYRKLCKQNPDLTKAQLKKSLSGIQDTYASKKAWKKEQNALKKAQEELQQQEAAQAYTAEASGSTSSEQSYGTSYDDTYYDSSYDSYYDPSYDASYDTSYNSYDYGSSYGSASDTYYDTGYSDTNYYDYNSESYYGYETNGSIYQDYSTWQ